MNDAELAGSFPAGDPTPSPEPLRRLVERLEEDQRTRWQRGEHVRVEEYLEQHPALRAFADGIVDLVYNEFLLRREGGEESSLEEYLQRFPHLARQLQDQFEVHAALTRSFSSVDGVHSAAPRELPAIPGYEIIKELGHGGMGVVYWAWQTSLNRTVALKMVLAGAHARPEELTRFRTEAQAVGRLQHPHIVQIYHVGRHEAHPYIALEYVEGGSLAAKLAGTPLPFRRAAELTQTLARAMHYAHQQGVVHRDLKPANVLLTADGTPKITDFGFAKLLVGGGEAPTQSEATFGTASYMPPEQASGKSKTAGPAADVYALGAILYEMLTGRPPFRAESALETLLQVQALDPVPPSRLRPKLPRDLGTICLKAMAKVPGRRYGTARELAEDLERFLQGEPIRARPVGAAERLWRWSWRNRALASATGFAAVALVAVVLLVIGFALQQSDAAAKLRREQEKTAAALADAEQRGRDVERSLARLTRHQGLTLYEQGSVGPGMLLLARSLETAPAEDTDFQRAIRADLAGWHRQLRRLRAVLDHPAKIEAVAFSPDSNTMVTGGRDGTARLWDVATGRPIGAPLRHQATVHTLAFSPDGKSVLTGSDDATARLWHAATGEPLGPPLRHSAKVWMVAFSPDGKTVLTGGWDNSARRWEAASGKPIDPPLQHGGPVVAGAFSPDGTFILTGAFGDAARLWDAVSGKLIEPVLHHEGGVQSLAFSPDGRTVVTGGVGFTAMLWEVATRKAIGAPLQHPGGVRSVAFSPDGKTVLTGSEGGMARLWQADTGQPVGEPLEHRALVQSVAFSPDGRSVLTGSSDKTARLWDAATGKPLGQPLPMNGDVMSVAFSPDGRFILAGDTPGARLWEAAPGKPTVTVFQHKKEDCPSILKGTVPFFAVGAVAFHPDGRRILTGSGDPLWKTGEAQLWDVATQRRLGPALAHRLPVLAIAFSPDGTRFATGSGHPVESALGGEVQLWETASGKPVYPKPLRHEGSVFSVAFSPDGRTLVTGSLDMTACLWQAASGHRLHVLQHDRGVYARVYAVAFSPDGKTVLTGAADGKARLWDVDTGKLLDPPLAHPGSVMGVAFSPDGQIILTGCDDRSARLWKTDSGKQLGNPLLHQGWVRAVAFSPDGQTILTGSADSTAQLWEAATGKPIGARLPHQHWVTSVAFSADGKTVLTGSMDGSARLWEVAFQPLEGTVERVVLWIQLITGMEVDPSGAVHVFDPETWRQRSQRLEDLGGPPVR